MTDVLGSLTTELRITGHLFRETTLGIKRTGWMNLVIVMTMASILSIFGILMAVLFQMGSLIHTLGSELEISVYVRDGVNPRVVRDEIYNMPNVKKIELISKEKAWADWQKENPLPEIQNPLPDTIHIQMSDVNRIPETVDKLKRSPNIIAVQYAKKVLDKVRGITQGASVVGFVVSLFLGTLTLFIISNTIHLLIQAKSREIEILRMMGVGNWFIRMPFLLQGGVYGLGGALIAYFPLSIAVYYLNLFFSYLGFENNELTLGTVVILLILMGAVVGGGGAAFAVRKYLHV
jgi:cell division transport system permease protein